MKSINLLAHAFSTKLISDMDLIVFNKIETEVYKQNVRKKEEDDLRSFLKCLGIPDFSVYDNFYYNYTIPQIGKEFDILRISNDLVLNIELKSECDLETIKKQVLSNEYYLNIFGKEVLIFSFVVNTKTIYKLVNKELVEISIDDLISVIKEQDSSYIVDIDELFDPIKYLISPFNQTKQFIEGKYFLNNVQREIKAKIYKNFDDENEIVMLEGEAGSGKTLLSYDIAKDIMEKEPVLIIHCAFLNEGQTELIETFKWNIIPIKKYKRINYQNYQTIIIDEGQRIDENQFRYILDQIQKYGLRLLFVYDPKQVLSMKEYNSSSISMVKNLTDISCMHKLSGKIRTNKEIIYFIKDLFDLSHKTNYMYKNIQVSYFEDTKLAYHYIKHLVTNKQWSFINYTQSKYSKEKYDMLEKLELSNAHKIIGQECDKVIVLINDKFYYENNRLMSKGWKAPYIGNNMLYEAITRTRKELYLIIVDNFSIYKVIMDILISSDKNSIEYTKLKDKYCKEQ